jgi:AAA family ATPase
MTVVHSSGFAPDNVHVVARLQSATTLDGAFRMHLPPDSLIQGGLKIGEVCSVHAEDGTNGYGIAWRAEDRMGNKPKKRPVKISEVAQNAFGFKEGVQVSLIPAKLKILPAKRVFLEAAACEEDSVGTQDLNDRLWRVRTHNLLGNRRLMVPTSGRNSG